MAAALETLLQDWRGRLRAWSADGSLASAARHALELEGEQPLLDELVAQWAAGDFSDLPPITLLPASSMPGAAGAYAISTGTIYLNQNWLDDANDEWAISVLTEELGHHLDDRLNRIDTNGDEGNRFALLLIGKEAASEKTIQDLREQDDSDFILLNGIALAIEKADMTSGPRETVRFFPGRQLNLSGILSNPKIASADLDNDGINDWIVSNSSGHRGLYWGNHLSFISGESGKSMQIPVLNLIGNDFVSYSALHAAPSSVDLDGDGDSDLILSITQAAKNFWIYFENKGSPTNPQFQVTTNPLAGIQIEAETTITFADIDGDGDQDGFTSDAKGNIFYIENYGTAKRPIFNAKATDPYGINTSIGLQGSILFVDWDSDGDLDVFSGSDVNQIAYQENIGSEIEPIFSAPVSVQLTGKTGAGASLASGDTNKDGLNDLIIAIGDFAFTSDSETIVTFERQPDLLTQIMLRSDKSSIKESRVLANPQSMLTLTLERLGDLSDPLEIKFRLGGTADYGTDYYILGGLTSFTFEAGRDISEVRLVANYDDIIETDETVDIYLEEGRYMLSDQNPARIAIVANDGVASFSILGTPAVGQILTATLATSDPDGDVEGYTTHTWQASANGTTWSDIRTGPELTITQDKEGKQLRVVTNYTDTQGFHESVVSEVVSIRNTPPANPAPPNLTATSDTGTSDSDNITSDTTPTFTGTAEPGSTINLLMDGVLHPANTAVTTADPITGEWSYTIPAEHAATEDITSSLTVTATDGAGNTSDESDPLVITIDLTPPVFVSGPKADPIIENSGAGQVVYVAKATDTHAVQYRLKPDNGDNSALFGINTITGDVTLKTNPDYEKQQSYSFTVVATDVAGNSTEKSVSLAINDQPETGPSLDAIAEYGQASMNHGWSRVTLNNSYTNPVVITSDPTLRGGDPVAVRIRNIGSNAFDLRLQEPNYKDGAHTNETISYLVVEAGDWQLSDGTRLSAGIHSTSKLSTQGFDTVSIGSGFQAAPAVLTQTQSFKGGDWVTTRTRAIGTGSFELTMQEEEKNNRSGHAKEDIGWVAIERGSSSALQADLTGDTFTDQLSSHIFATPFSSTPTLLTKLASYDGADVANTRIRSVSATGFSALVQEEQSQDQETAHTTESLAFLALAGSSGVLSGTAYQPTLEVAEYAQISVDHNWSTVQLQNTYTAPVVITSDPTLRGGDPVVVRLRNINANSFDLRLQEPNYKDGAHTRETISYMVIEAGTWTLPDGTTIAAGTKDTNKLSTQGREVIALPGAFDPAQAPAVLTQTQTFNGGDWVTTRTDTITGRSFQVMMQEEEKLNRGGHATETIGWLAVDSGIADDGDTLIEGGTTPRAFDHNGGSASFQQTFSKAPTLLTKLSSFHGADVANSRISTVSSTGFSAVIQEEQSLDSEIAHTRESLSFLALEGSSGILQAIAPPAL